jgi:LysR family transcriptional regulator, regulator for bpeEF and oprC
MDEINAISVFVRVAEARSFVGAATRLGISPSAASKSLTRLEQRLGVRLLNRTTRSVSLTDDGLTFFESCRDALRQFEDAEIALTRSHSQPRGRLRVLMPAGFGRAILVPVLAEFAELHPALVVDVEFASRASDLADEGIDVVILTGHPGDRRLIARKLCDIRYVAVASPDYLARCGEPATPADLGKHRCLGYHVPQTHRYRDWNFAAAGRPLIRHVSGNLNMNDGAALIDAAIACAGIAMAATFLVAAPVQRGELRLVLRDYVSAGPPVCAAYLRGHHISNRIRTFIDFLLSQVPQSSASWDRILKLA